MALMNDVHQPQHNGKLHSHHQRRADYRSPRQNNGQRKLRVAPTECPQRPDHGLQLPGLGRGERVPLEQRLERLQTRRCGSLCFGGGAGAGVRVSVRGLGMTGAGVAPGAGEISRPSFRSL